MLEEARSLGELVKAGWKPKRTIVYCAWDGEEPGLLGSTEWVETHADELRSNAVAYINSDTNGRGFLGVEARTRSKNSSTTSRAISPIPRPSFQSGSAGSSKSLTDATSDEARAELRSRSDLRIDISGGGSDSRRLPEFPRHRGAESTASAAKIRAASIIRSTTISTGTRISATRISSTASALAQVAGTTVMRLADADLLPFDFSDQADTVQTYVRGLQSYGVQQQNEIRERNLEIEEGAFTASADPKQKYVPPAKQDMPPHLNFAPLQNGADA